jgi:hypothetical protein
MSVMSRGHGNKLAFEQELREEWEAIWLSHSQNAAPGVSREYQEKSGDILGLEWILPFLSFLLFER